jgi:hypothetical protein
MTETLNLKELEAEKQALKKVVEVAVENFIEKTGYTPSIAVNHTVTELKTMCETISSQKLDVTVWIQL